MTGVPADGLVFIHVSKTGGQTVRGALRRIYGDSLSIVYNFGLLDWMRDIGARDSDGQSSLRAVAGHMPYGFHEMIPRFTKYTTMLRNPIDRIVSHYYYVLEDPNNRLHDEIVSRSMSLREYVHDISVAPLMNNGATRFLGQATFSEDVGPATDERFERALARLDHITIGLTERFDESLLMMRRLFGWSAPYYSVRHRSRLRPRLDEIDAETASVIAEANHFDMLLYQRAIELFESQIAEYPGDLESDLVEFRAENERRAEIEAGVS